MFFLFFVWNCFRSSFRCRSISQFFGILGPLLFGSLLEIRCFVSQTAEPLFLLTFIVFRLDFQGPGSHKMLLVLPWSLSYFLEFCRHTRRGEDGWGAGGSVGKLERTTVAAAHLHNAYRDKHPDASEKTTIVRGLGLNLEVFGHLEKLKT